jgi:hypothetical protein
MIENIAYFFYKTSYFNEEVNCTVPSTQLAFPDLTIGYGVASLGRYVSRFRVARSNKYDYLSNASILTLLNPLLIDPKMFRVIGILNGVTDKKSS